ncbi:hypothetical protein LTR67_004677 [Exophiala xenobiotica]
MDVSFKRTVRVPDNCDHPDLRQRGLRGGQARKQMATGVPFVSITKLAPAERQRRTNVEAQDYKARTRRTGLEKLKTIFKSCYKLIEEQQTLAKQVVERGNFPLFKTKDYTTLPAQFLGGVNESAAGLPRCDTCAYQHAVNSRKYHTFSADFLIGQNTATIITMNQWDVAHAIPYM